MKLAFKHIAPYLPFNLKCNIMGEYLNDTHVTLKKFDIIGATKTRVEVSYKGTTSQHFEYQDVFPILKPLSDLEQKMFIGDRIIIPVFTSSLKDIHFGFQFATGENSLNLFNYLFKNHFDVYNLIGNKLSVANTKTATPF